MSSLALDAPSHVDEPGLAAGDADVFSRVATNGPPVIVRRAGEDLAAVVPWQSLKLVQDDVARQQAEQISAALSRNAYSPQPGSIQPAQRSTGTCSVGRSATA